MINFHTEDVTNSEIIVFYNAAQKSLKITEKTRVKLFSFLYCAL